MIIDNQEKNRIVNFNNILDIHTQGSGEKSLIFAETERYAIFLGEYKTEKRAKEVLQEIIKTYETEKIYKCSDAETQEIMCNLCLENNQDIFKYEMPEK